MTRPRFAVFTLLALCLCAPIGALAADDDQPESYVKLLEQEIAKLKAEGQPTTLADLNAPPIPDDQNAAILYDKAFAALRDPAEHEWEARDAVVASFPWEASPQQIQALKKHVAKNSEALELLRRAAERDMCRFKFDYVSGFTTPGGHDVAISVSPGTRHFRGAFARQSARLVLYKAAADKLEGRVTEAAEACWLIVRMGNALCQEPSVVTHLLGNAIIGIGLLSLENILYDGGIPKDIQRKLTSELQPARLRDAMSFAVSGDLANAQVFLWAVGVLEPPKELGEEWVAETLGVSDEWPEQYQGPETRNEALAREGMMYLRWTSQTAEALRQPYFASKEELGRIEGDIASHETPFAKHMYLGSYPSHLAAIQGRINAKAGCLEIVFALKDHKAEHGKYPDSLDELAEQGSALPVDPFSGKPFLYKKQAEGFIVYSVGKNEADDGGEEPKDIVWRCAR